MSFLKTPTDSSLVQLCPVLPQHPVLENPQCEIRSFIPMRKNRQNYSLVSSLFSFYVEIIAYADTRMTAFRKFDILSTK